MAEKKPLGACVLSSLLFSDLYSFKCIEQQKDTDCNTIQISIQQIYLELSQSIVQIPTKPTVCTAFWCQETGRTWEEAHRDQDPGHVEVSGFHDSTGHFHWSQLFRFEQILTDGAMSPNSKRHVRVH